MEMFQRSTNRRLLQERTFLLILASFAMRSNALPSASAEQRSNDAPRNSLIRSPLETWELAEGCNFFFFLNNSPKRTGRPSERDV